MTEQKIQVGDKVRITYEGVVTDVNKYNEPMIDGGEYFYTDASRPLGEKYQAGKVEILEKRPPQVGDVIEGPELDALPVGSLVAFEDERDSPIMRTHDGWVSTRDRHHETQCIQLPRVVVYIP